MEQEFNEEFLASQLETLSRFQRLAFLLSCCERLYPNYVAFSKNHAWGEPGVLRNVLDFAWSALEGEDVSERIDDLIIQCDAVIPDTEDFDSEYVSPALDASVSALLLLKLLKEDSAVKAAEAASLACDTVDMYVQEYENMDSDDPAFENLILKHPLMQDELRRQREDIGLLKKTDLSDGASLAALKIKWREQKQSNIGF